MGILKKHLLFSVLFLSIFFINKTAFANDLNRGTSFQLKNIENFDNIIENLENSQYGIDFTAVIRNTPLNNYIKYDHNHIFRVNDNSLELLELSANNSKLLSSIELDNFNINNLYIKDNYLILVGDEIENSLTSIKLFNINNLDAPFIVKEFTITGNIVHIKFSGDLMTVFSKHKPYEETYLDLSFLPYYSVDGKQTFFNVNNIYSLPSESNENNYLCGITVSLEDDIIISDAKAIWGVGQSIYSDDHFIYLASSVNNTTQVLKLSIDTKLFLNNYKVILPGNMTFYDALNIQNNSLKLITTLKTSEEVSFAIYLLDDSLNIQDTYFTSKNSIIDNFYFIDDNLFVKYYASSSNYLTQYASFSFNNNRISINDVTKIITGDMYYTDDYIYSLVITPGESSLLTMYIYNWDYNLIDKVNLSTKDAYGLKGLMYYDENNKVLALPMTLKSDHYKEHLLIYKQNAVGKFEVGLITTFDNGDTYNDDNYIDQISEYMTMDEDYLYTISHNFINVYDLKTNTLINRNPLD